MTGFDLDEVDRLLTTTKQVRKRLDLTRPVPANDLLEIIEIANHAPMGGNLERNRWLIVTDAGPQVPDRRTLAPSVDRISPRTPRSAATTAGQKVIESAEFLVDHLAEVPALVIALRLDRPPLDPSTQGGAAAYFSGSCPACGASSSQHELAASVRHGRRSTSSTNPRSPRSSASRRPSPRCVSSPSATTPATRSHPLPADGPAREVTYVTVGSKLSSSGESGTTRPLTRVSTTPAARSARPSHVAVLEEPPGRPDAQRQTAGLRHGLTVYQKAE